MHTFAVAGFALVVTPIYIAFGCAVGTLLRDTANFQSSPGSLLDSPWGEPGRGERSL